ncbi:MAG: 30S ribosomal protein S20 [Alphaproteobacteria bacterium]|nr:30S ribosomal protein S20 [Alphaproteobacteria bacterium]
MANHASAKKRVRRNDKRKLINTARKSRIRTFLKKVELAIAAGDATQAQQALQSVQPELQRAVSKGLWHKNTAARKLSRLSARVKAI